jgi:hypothetical protein
LRFETQRSFLARPVEADETLGFFDGTLVAVCDAPR